MVRLFSLLLTFVVLLVAAACGDSDGDNTDTTATTTTTTGSGDTGGDGDGDRPDLSFVPLITDEWVMPSTDEGYECAAFTLTEDVYIGAFRSLSPPGTHHTVLSVAETPTRADGPYDCGANDLQHSMLFASGVGTDDLFFPEGVAIKVEAGSQLHLNLHLFNATDSPLTGLSGTEGAYIQPEDVEQLAEVVFGGTFRVLVADRPNQEQTIRGGCDFSQNATVIALWPHMHQLGTHMTVSVGGDMLHDQAFDFDEQINYKIEPYEVAAGDGVDVACTYINNTGRDVRFGDSSTDEMCFVGIYRYPATGAGLFSCTR